MTEIKCNIFGRVRLLKNFFFFRMFIFQWIWYSNVVIYFRLRNRPSIKYVSNWGNGGGVVQNVYRYVQGEGSWKTGHKIRTYEMDGPKQILWNIFCALVWLSTLEHHCQQEKCRCFLPSKLRLFYLCDNRNLLSFFYIRISTKKQVLDFLTQRNSLHKCLFKTPLWRQIDNATSYFLISSKDFSKIIGGRVTVLWII